jgi:hypothetical protein
MHNYFGTEMLGRVGGKWGEGSRGGEVLREEGGRKIEYQYRPVVAIVVCCQCMVQRLS